MKNTDRLIQLKNSARSIGLGLVFSVMLALGASSTNAATTDENPMCAKFAGNTALLGSDGKGIYCQGADVLCGSAGKGFVLTTTFASPSQRKAWIDLKNAPQYNSPPVAARMLPQGQMEVEINWMGPNDAAGNFLPDVVPAPLTMAPGESYISGLRVRFIDGKNYYDLRFGQPRADAISSGSPVVVTAGDDFDADGVADIWTVQPLNPDAKAILFKGKPNYDAAPGSLIGRFQVPFMLVYVRAQFSHELDSIP